VQDVATRLLAPREGYIVLSSRAKLVESANCESSIRQRFRWALWQKATIMLFWIIVVLHRLGDLASVAMSGESLMLALLKGRTCSIENLGDSEE
jgi:hypothetical protein